MSVSLRDQNNTHSRWVSSWPLALLVGALVCTTYGCGQNTSVQNSNSQSNSKTAANEPVVSWAEGSLIVGDQTYKLNHAYAMMENDPFNESEYTIRVLLSEQPISQETLDDHTALMNMKNDATNHALEIDIDEQRKVKWIAIWGLGQVSGMEYPFEPVVFNERMVEGRLFIAKPETAQDTKWQYDAKFKSSVRVDPITSFLTSSTGRPLEAGGGEAGKAYLDYQAAIRTAKGPEDLDKFYSKPVLKDRNANPEMKEFVMEMEKESLLEDIKIAGGFVDGDKATLSLEGKREGEGNLSGRVNMHLEDGQWKIGAQAFRGGD